MATAPTAAVTLPGRSTAAQRYCSASSLKTTGKLRESERPAAGAEDPNPRHSLEETLRNFRECLRRSDLVPRGRRQIDPSEARRSQRETHGKQIPFAQHPHRRSGGRRRRSGIAAATDHPCSSQGLCIRPIGRGGAAGIGAAIGFGGAQSSEFCCPATK